MACDIYGNKVILACHFDGTNGSTTISDEKGHTLTANGNAQISTTQSKFGGSSLYLDGSGDYVEVTTDFSFLLNEFTIEFWCYCNDNTNNYPSIVSTQGGWSNGAFCIRFDNTGYTQKFTVHWNGATPGDPFIASSSTYSYNQWRHVALVRNTSGGCTLFVDGINVGSNTYTPLLNLQYGGNLRLGWSTWDGAAGYYLGYIDDLRITKAARYTTNFTPPTSTFVSNQCIITGTVLNNIGLEVSRLVRAYNRNTGALVGSTVSSSINGIYTLPVSVQEPVTVVCLDGIITESYPEASIYQYIINYYSLNTDFTENFSNYSCIVGAGTSGSISASQYKFDGNSAYFGSYGWMKGIYTNLPSTSDFTLECWFYATSFPDDALFLWIESGSGTSTMGLMIHSSTLCYGWYNNGTTTVTTNTWHHAAISRTNGTSRWFLDGVIQGTVYSDTRSVAGYVSFGDGGDRFRGYIDQVVTYSYGRYTTNFTPDTQPISPSALSTNTYNALIHDGVIPG